MGFIIVVVIVVIVVAVFLARRSSSEKTPHLYPPREQQDLAEMQREAPNAEPQYFEDGIVWYEWTTQGGRRFYLAYWYESGDYKDAVMEGDNPEDRGQPAKCHLFDNREICLKGSTDPPYKRVAEARSRAILWALGYSEYLKTGEFPWNKIEH